MAITKIMKNFVRMQSAQGIILFFFAILAVLISNSQYQNIYQQFFSISVPLNLNFLNIFKDLTIKDWINDALMAVFFLFVGLELKREIIIGELSDKSKLMLPALAAIGGVICPALIYLYFNIHDSFQAKGFAISSATDIAFAIAVLNLFGNKIHNNLKIFLVALAVLDDLAAILIIAFFYSNNIDIYYIALSLAVILILLILNKIKIINLIPYLICGIFLWIFVLKSGIHATIAGILLAFFIPLAGKNKKENTSPLHILEKKLHNIVGYLILPIFAFANSGIIFSGISIDIFSSEIVIGIIAGLFIGKQIGVFSVVFLLDRWRIASLFHHSSKLEVYGVCILTGIGFTMSLFIGNLAFPNSNLDNEVIFAVLSASLLSGIVGFLTIFIGIRLRKSIKNRSYGK